MPTSDDIIIEHHRVADLFRTLDAIKAQTTQTNGRVTELERRSVGYWMANHQTQSIGLSMGLLCILISELRNPILNFIISFFVKR